MPATSEGNYKVAANQRAKHGVGPDGKSLYHQELGKKSIGRSEGYFAKLKRENPAELARIASHGAKVGHERAKVANRTRYGLNYDEAQPHTAEG